MFVYKDLLSYELSRGSSVLIACIRHVLYDCGILYDLSESDDDTPV